MGVFDEDTGSSKGVMCTARADFPGRGFFMNGGFPPAFQALFTAYSDGGIAGFYTNGLDDTGGADITGRLVGNRLAERMRRFDRVLNIGVFTDDDVEPHNRVTLSQGHGPDEHGSIPKVFFDHRHRSTRTRSNREFLVRQAVELLRAAGAHTVHRLHFPPLVFHPMSTMRMGLDAANSVCDENGAARAVRHLYIADNSVLANGLGGPNPTLTTQALATRTAEKIFTLEFGGQPWVRQEAPVSSIDPAVTEAVLAAG
jgi:GMC oxidoreductase